MSVAGSLRVAGHGLARVGREQVTGDSGLPPCGFAALSETCTAVLRAAAVAGPRVSADLVARATGGSPAAVAVLLADAVQARAAWGADFFFRHPKALARVATAGTPARRFLSI